MAISLQAQVGSALDALLKRRALSRRAAASLFKQPASFITNRVRGANLTLRSVDRLFAELGATVTITVAERVPVSKKKKAKKTGRS